LQQSKTAASKTADIEKLAKEYIAKIIMGQWPIDKYDEFADQVQKMGLADALKEINESYKK
jgi:putative aldouronate transport system substrate-binding protein